MRSFGVCGYALLGLAVLVAAAPLDTDSLSSLAPNTLLEAAASVNAPELSSGSNGLRPVPSISLNDGSGSAAVSAQASSPSLSASAVGSSASNIPLSSSSANLGSSSGSSAGSGSTSGSSDDDGSSAEEEEEEADSTVVDGLDGDEITNSDQWVKKLIKRYTGGAKKGKVKGGKSKISIVGNSNTLRKEETPDGDNDEELFKRTQLEIRQQAAEQLSKRADEDKIKKAEDVSKQRVIALKKLAKEEQLKQDQAQDEKVAQEEAQKAQEANSKKEGEQAQKDKVAQAQREAQAEHAKALKDLELKKKEEAKEKDEMRKKAEEEIAAAKAAAQRQREAAAAALAAKKAQEQEKKKQERAREEAEKDEAKKKQVEQENKVADRKKATVHAGAFNPRNGWVIAGHSALWPTQQWTGAYTYSFWVRPSGVRGGWANLIHNGAVNHHRNPAVWFYPGQTRLHIRSGATENPQDWNGYTNYGCDPGRHLDQNVWTWVCFSHSDNSMNVYYGDVNGNLQHVCQLNYPRPVQNTGDLFAGDPWHEQPLAMMADLRVYNRVLNGDDMNRILREKVGIA